MKLITEEGNFALPLYHGTSDFFVSMILETGLGRRDIVAEWRLLDFIGELFEVKKVLLNSRSLTAEADLAFFFVENARRQDVTAGGFNFRHGGIYVSAAYNDALRYCQNAKGSEIITMIYNVLTVLPENHRDHCFRILSGYRDLERAVLAKHNPRILILRNVPVKSLKSEIGRSAMESIKLAEGFLDSAGPIDDVALQFCRFEAVSLDDPKLLEVEEVCLS